MIDFFEELYEGGNMQEVINLLLMSVFTFIIGAIVGLIIGGIVKRTRVRKARNELKDEQRKLL